MSKGKLAFNSSDVRVQSPIIAISARAVMESDVLKSSVDDQVNIKWSQQPQTLGEILQENSLPLIVRIHSQEADPAPQNPQDISAPLVLFKEITGTKVFVKNVTSIEMLEGAPVKKDSPTVVIPDTYQGWFRLLDEMESPLKTVANVAMLMPIRVLSTKFVSGFVRDLGAESDPNNCLFDKVEVQPGVLKVKDVYEDYIKYTTKRKSTKRKLLRCLRCAMEDDTEVYLPFDAQGSFFLIETRKSTSKHINLEKIGFVYSLADLISAGLSNNIFIKLIHGRPPTKPCGYTSIFSVTDKASDHSVIGCTFNDQRHMLEIPVNNVPNFVKCENVTEMYLDKQFAETLEHLEANVNEYQKEIKVRYNYSVPETSMTSQAQLQEP